MNNDKIEASELPPKLEMHEGSHDYVCGYNEAVDAYRAAIAMHRAAAANPECQYPHETAKCAGCGWEQAAAAKPIARLHEQTGDHGIAAGKKYFEITILDKAQCFDGMNLYASPVATAEPVPTSEMEKVFMGTGKRGGWIKIDEAAYNNSADWSRAIFYRLAATKPAASEAVGVPDCENCAYAQSTSDDREMFCHLHVKNVTEPCAEYQAVFIDRLAAPAAPTDAGVRDEPDMLWLTDDPEVFANGPDDFANDYASDCLHPGEDAEVSVDCAYRGSKRTMRISVADVGNDESKTVWEWVDQSSPQAPKTEGSGDA